MSKSKRRFRFVAIALGIAIASFLSRSLWAGPLISGLAPIIASAFDVDLEIEQANGDGTSQLELIGVRVGDLGESQPLRKLVAESITFNFSLYELLLGGSDAVQRIQSVGLDLELDFRRSESAPEDEPAANEQIESEQLLLPELDLERSNITVLLNAETELAFLSTSLRSAPNGQAVIIEADEFEYRAGEQAPIASRLEAQLNLNSGGIEIEELNWDDHLALRDSSFDWQSPTTGGLSWNLNAELLDGKAEIAGQFVGASELDVSFDASRVNLAKLGTLWPPARSTSGHVQSLVGELHWSLTASQQITGHLQARAHELSIGQSEPMSLEGRLDFENGLIRSPQIELKSELNRLNLTQIELPIELGEPLEQLRRGRFHLEVDAQNIPQLLGSATSEPEVGAHHLQVFLALDQGLAQVQRGRFTTEGGALTIESGTIRAVANQGPEVDLSMFADFSDLEPLGRLVGKRPWGGTLSGQVKVNGTWPQLSATAELTGEATKIANVNLGHVEVRLELDDQHLVIPALSSVNDGNRLSLSGAVALVNSQPTFEDLLIDLDVTDLNQVLPGFDATGQLHIHAEATGAVGALVGVWTLNGEDLKFKKHAFNQFVSNGKFNRDRVQINELNFASSGVSGLMVGDLQVDADWNVRTLGLSKFTLEGGGQNLALEEPTNLSFESTWPSFDSISLAGSVGSLKLYSKFDPIPTSGQSAEPSSTYRLGFEADEFAPMFLLEPFLNAGYVLDGIAGQLHATLDEGQLSFESELRIEQFEMPLVNAAGSKFDHPWRVKWNAKLIDGELQIDEFEAHSDDTSHLAVSGKIPIRPLHSEPLAEGPLDLRAQLKLPKLGAFRAFTDSGTPWPMGNLSLSAELTGDWKQPAGSLAIDAQALDLDIDNEPLFRQAEVSGQIQFGESTTLNQLSVQIPNAFAFLADGSFNQPIDISALAKGSMPFAPQTPIQLHVDLSVEDSTWLNRLHQSLGTGDLFHRLGGQVNGNLDLTGTIENPTPKGQLEVANGEFKLSSELPTIQNIRGVIRVDERRFEFDEFAGDIGGESLQVAGHFDLDEQAPNLDVVLSGSNLLLYRSSGVKIRSNVELFIKGTPSEPRVEGELQLTDSRFVKRFDFLALGRSGGQKADRALPLFSFRDDPFARTQFDVTISSEAPFRIDNNVAKARIRPDLRLQGSGRLPELSGVLYIDGGKVSLPVNDLFLRPGTIRFEPNAPMIPKLELLLQNRIRGYDVTVTVAGDYDDPTVTTSSSPPLGPEDMAALVWAGQDPGEGLSAKTGKSSAQAIGAFIVQDLLTRMFSDESTESEESFLNRFELYLGRDTTQSGSETIEMTFEVTDNVFGPSDTLYLATERDIYSHVNFGLRFVFRFH
ncbi:MAG: hypothetical protein ACI8TQ_003021 [Planctomycetota bacterium]